MMHADAATVKEVYRQSTGTDGVQELAEDEYIRATLARQLEPLLAAKAKEQQIRKPESVPQISAEQKIDTREELAKIAGVSHDTFRGNRSKVTSLPAIYRILRRGRYSPNSSADLHPGV